MDKTRLLARLEAGHALLDQALDDLAPHGVSETGTADHWTVKDALAHMTAWAANWSDWLAPLLRGEDPPTPAPPLTGAVWDEANARIHAENMNRPWREVRAAFERVYRQTREEVRGLSDRDLTDPHRFAWLEERPIWKRMVGDFYWHMQNHLSQLYTERGQGERALQVAAAFADPVCADAEAPDRDTALYNLGCFYSLAGQAAPAIEQIRAAFALNPALVEWSRQDSDLDPLRDDPGFKALFPSS